MSRPRTLMWFEHLNASPLAIRHIQFTSDFFFMTLVATSPSGYMSCRNRRYLWRVKRVIVQIQTGSMGGFVTAIILPCRFTARKPRRWTKNAALRAKRPKMFFVCNPASPSRRTATWMASASWPRATVLFVNTTMGVSQNFPLEKSSVSNWLVEVVSGWKTSHINQIVSTSLLFFILRVKSQSMRNNVNLVPNGFGMSTAIHCLQRRIR